MTDPHRLRIDGASLKRDGDALVDEAADLVHDLAALATILTGIGEAWGDDEVGASFGPAYLGFVDHLVSAVVTYRDQVATPGVTLAAGGATVVERDRSHGERAASIVQSGAAPPSEPTSF